MAKTMYDIDYSVYLNDGSVYMGSFDFYEDEMKEIFDHLYEEVVIGSITDQITEEVKGTPEMINEIRITIAKKSVNVIRKAGSRKLIKE